MLFERGGNYLKWVLTCLVFFALPFLLIAYGVGNRWKIQENEHRERAFEELDSVLATLRKHEAPREYFNYLLERINLLTEGNPHPLTVVRGGLNELRRRFPGIFTFYVVDSTGSIVESLSDRVPSKTILKKLYFALVPEDKGIRLANLQKSWAIFKSFIGPAASPELMIFSSRELFEVTDKEKNRRFFYWTTPAYGIFAHVSNPPHWPLLAVTDKCRRFLKYRSHTGIKTGICDLGTSVSQSLEIDRLMTEFQRTTNQHIQIRPFFYSVMGLSPTTRIWASRPAGRVGNFDLWRISLTLIGTLLFAFLSFVSFGVMVQEKPFVFPIRWRLVVLFFFASGLPLAVIIFAGWDYLYQKYKTRVRETYDETERNLRAFDARFPMMRGMMETRMNRILKDITYDTPENIRKTQRLFTTGKDLLKNAEAYVYDKTGNYIWNHGKDQSGEKVSQGRKVMGKMLRSIMANLNEEDPGPPDPTIMMIESVGGAENLLNQISRNLGRINDFSFGNAQNWNYIKPLKSSDGKKFSHMVTCFWQKNRLEELYLQTQLLSAQRSMPGLLLLGTKPEWNWQFPKDAPYGKPLTPFSRALFLRQATINGTLSYRSKTYLVTGIKPKELEESLLIGLISDEAIQKEISSMRMGLWVFTALSGLMSGFLGIILSQRFLTPISQLSQGVEAIQKRNFTHRLPKGENDELGDLSRTFNQVMEGLSDLEVARIVQESLFTKEEVKVGEYRAFGKTTTASELGGDYFDVQALSDNRILVLIGDVSGHGVPAALVMAMAKALVERECEAHPRPEVVLESIHRVLFKTLKRKRMMSCFMGILDPELNQLVLANAGHNFPYFFQAGKPPQTIVSQAKPLGSWKKIGLEAQTLMMEPGDRLLMYTDGLVEAKARDGVIGYDRMSEAVQKMITEDPVESVDRIFTWLYDLAGKGPQEDDISLVILTRKGKQT